MRCRKTEKLKSVSINEDFGTILICAVRHSIGRRSYMPGLVQDYIRPILPSLDIPCHCQNCIKTGATSMFPGMLYCREFRTCVSPDEFCKRGQPEAKKDV